MNRLEALRKQLQAPLMRERGNAVSAIVRLGLRELSAEVLRLFEAEREAGVKARCAWALGRLRFRTAVPALQAGLHSAEEEEVRVWCAWALGELGYADLEPSLRRAQGRDLDDNVKRAIGGALKKLRLESTRVPKERVLKQLRPPATRSRKVQAIVERLASLEWPRDRELIILLRRTLRDEDSVYFEQYIRWIKAKPILQKALEGDQWVY